MFVDVVSMQFECLHCGDCCRNLLIEQKWTLGLFLMRREKEMFPKDKVVPMYGVGIKGNSRPRPKLVFAWQFTENVCPHLDGNKCKIYDRRPLACRGYPLQLWFTGGILQRDCRAVRERGIEEGAYIGRLREIEGLEEEFKAQKRMLRFIKRAYEAVATPQAWVRDLKDGKWKGFKDDGLSDTKIYLA